MNVWVVKTSEMLAKGIPVGISVDTSALTGSSNLFAVLKLARDVENAKADLDFIRLDLVPFGDVVR